jgi:ATP-binding cassette subfamily F protein 3
LHGLVNVIFEVTPQGLREYRGDIFDFLQDKKAASIAEFERSNTKSKKLPETDDKAPPAAVMAQRDKKELEKELKRLKNRSSKVEQEIAAAEARIAEMDHELASLDYSNQEKSTALLGFYAAEKERLEKLMDEWSDLEDASERINAQLQ